LAPIFFHPLFIYFHPLGKTTFFHPLFIYLFSPSQHPVSVLGWMDVGMVVGVVGMVVSVLGWMFG
jgi:hypothetical protein